MGLVALALVVGSAVSVQAGDKYLELPPPGPADIHHLEVQSRGPYRFPYFRLDYYLFPLCPREVGAMYPPDGYADIHPRHKTVAPRCHWIAPSGLYSFPELSAMPAKSKPSATQPAQ
jgi:hypothetical protein